jgi:hypothetical protein
MRTRATPKCIARQAAGAAPGRVGTAETRQPGNCYDALILLPTVVYVVFALLPRIVTAVMQAMMISASMTAYSTAVGPSSPLRNSTNDLGKYLNIWTLFSGKIVKRTHAEHAIRNADPDVAPSRVGRS